jgi:sugar phosphate isomerase/epimerase
MILADYFRSERDAAWDIAKQCGVSHGIIRLPEDGKFDYAERAHWDALVKRFTDFGITPVAIEPMPNELHDHIKLGDGLRDESIARVISMFPNMRAHGIDCVAVATPQMVGSGCGISARFSIGQTAFARQVISALSLTSFRGFFSIRKEGGRQFITEL